LFIIDRKKLMKRILLLFIIAIPLLLPACGEPAELGTLHGKVAIGPLQPVVTPGEPAEVPCEVYEARKIMVYDKSAEKLIEQVDIDCEGRYSVKLEPGTYTVDINRIGIDFSKGLPAQVEIGSGITTRLDIDIDTGIR
jgi:hypothetical protein